MSDLTNRETCYICGVANEDILERHHIVPQRFGGDDTPPNVVDLCPNCHTALERLYDDRFYHELGVLPDGPSTTIDCEWCELNRGSTDPEEPCQRCGYHPATEGFGDV